MGTQALGALGASGALKGAFGQAGGQVGRMPVKKYQGGGALNSLINSTQGLDTQPVVGMGSGGGIMDILEISAPAVTGYKQLKKDGLKGLLNTFSPMFMAAHHDKLLQGTPDAPPPAAIPAASRVISPEELAKQKDAFLRQRAAQGQQAASAGAPRAQGSSQVGNQVRQSFKNGGGLRQMVNLPSNRVQFGKTAYANATTAEELAELERQRTLMGTGEYFSPLTLDITENIINPVVEGYGSAKQGLKDFIGQASSYLTGKGDSYFEAEREELMARQAKEKEAADKQAAAAAEQKAAEEERINALRSRNAADKKPAGEDLFLSPEEAGYLDMVEGRRFKDENPMINKQRNTALDNIGAALETYSDYQKTKMGQRRLIDADTRKKATAKAAARRARLEDQKTMSEIQANLNKPDVAALSALTKLLDDPALYDNPEKRLQIENEIKFYINKSQKNALRDITERGGVRYGANPTDMVQRIVELEAAKAKSKG